MSPKSGISNERADDHWIHTAVAAAATATVVGWVSWRLGRFQERQRHHLRDEDAMIPTILKESSWSTELMLAIRLAKEGKGNDFTISTTICLVTSTCRWFRPSQRACIDIVVVLPAGSNMVDYLEAKGTSRESSIDLGIETKSGAQDFCTKIDVENEKLIMDGIRTVFPHHDIIGEEAVGTGQIPPLKKEVPTWIIDPIGESSHSELSWWCLKVVRSLRIVLHTFRQTGQPTSRLASIP